MSITGNRPSQESTNKETQRIIEEKMDHIIDEIQSIKKELKELKEIKTIMLFFLRNQHPNVFTDFQTRSV